MRASRGFTIIELMVVVAIIGIIAALAVPTVRAARKNATVQSSAFELKIWLDGLRARAMRDQRQLGLLAVVVDVPKNDPSPCAHGSDVSCARYYLLDPGPGFVLNGFDPSKPITNVNEVIDEHQLGRGTKFYRGADGRAAPNPFNGITAFNSALVGDCGGRACIGIRFWGNGEVDPEYPTTTSGASNPLGVAFVLGSDVDKESLGSDQRGIVVTFPTGLVKAYSVAR